MIPSQPDRRPYDVYGCAGDVQSWHPISLGAQKKRRTTMLTSENLAKIFGVIIVFGEVVPPKR